jgi:hypothetical protein
MRRHHDVRRHEFSASVNVVHVMSIMNVTNIVLGTHVTHALISSLSVMLGRVASHAHARTSVRETAIDEDHFCSLGT